MADFLHKLSDSELLDAAELFYNGLNAAPATYGATAANVTDMHTWKNTFAADLSAHVAAQAEAKAKTQAKKVTRKELENIIRFIVQQARLNGIPDATLAVLGVPASGGGGSTSIPAATRPQANIDTSQRLRHTISFTDEALPGIKRRPAGVVGCEIYQKIGGSTPVDFKECAFLTLDTSTPYLVEFDGAEAGKMAHYMLRWRLKDESTSAWSETVSATITG